VSPWLDPAIRRARTRREVLRAGGRWTVLRKVEMFIALDAGIVTVTEVIEDCGLSPEEFLEWRDRYSTGGATALSALAARRIP
jgi:hypothetical protein